MKFRTRRSDKSQDIITIAIALFGMGTKREDIAIRPVVDKFSDWTDHVIISYTLAIANLST